MHQTIEINYKLSSEDLIESSKLEVPDQGVILITGNNGVGKSTLLKILSEQYFKNKSKSFMSPINQYNKDFPITVEDFIKYYLKTLHLPSSQYSEPIELSLINNKIHRALPQLSTGEFQALILWLNLSLNTEILFLDEPFSHLNEVWKNFFIAQIEKISKNQLVFWVTHEKIQLSENTQSITWHLEKRKINILTQGIFHG